MTSWKTTPGEARALAKVVQLVRGRSGGPEWHLAGIEDALDKARDLAPYPDLAHAALEAAREASNRTPAVIGMDGPHWRSAQVAPAFRPPDPWSLCFECGLTEAACGRKQLGSPDKHPFRSRGQVANTPVAEVSAKEAAIAAAKEAARAAHEVVCTHGARPGVPCRVCDADGVRSGETVTVALPPVVVSS